MYVVLFIVLSLALGISAMLLMRRCAETAPVQLSSGVLVSFATAVVHVALFCLGIYLGNKLHFVAADDDTVIDEVEVVVPTSCTMSGSGMTSHTATINNGTYNSNIGTTTFNVYCNDKDGFVIYAVGYTDDENGNNVLTNSALGSNSDIETGTGTTGNSQWAMSCMFCKYLSIFAISQFYFGICDI